jgi:hypothetical protein
MNFVECVVQKNHLWFIEKSGLREKKERVVSAQMTL